MKVKFCVCECIYLWLEHNTETISWAIDSWKWRFQTIFIIVGVLFSTRARAFDERNVRRRVCPWRFLPLNRIHCETIWVTTVIRFASYFYQTVKLYAEIYLTYSLILWRRICASIERWTSLSIYKIDFRKSIRSVSKDYYSMMVMLVIWIKLFWSSLA